MEKNFKKLKAPYCYEEILEKYKMIHKSDFT